MGQQESKGGSGQGPRNEKQAPGAGSTGFFTDVVNGDRDLANFPVFKPIIQSVALDSAAKTFADIGIGYFDAHIYRSIPTFFEMQRAIAVAVVEAFRNSESPYVLDLGASEGLLGKSISRMSEGHVRTVSVDPNPSMEKKFREGTFVRGASFSLSAIAPNNSTPPFIVDNKTIPYFTFTEEFNVIIENMLFQFLGVEREAYIGVIADALEESGLFICCEKFSSQNIEYFKLNEMQKDDYKLQYFSREEIERKLRDIVNPDNHSMGANLVDFEFMQNLLVKKFKFVGCFWDAGNFKGYVCSHTERNIKMFLYYLPDLNSCFSTRRTPFLISS